MDGVTATARMTAAEFLARPADLSARRWELVDGELVVNEPSRAHNGSQGRVFLALGQWVVESLRLA